eukprot:2815170-Lingulodinium_polyedra.AAC.1
MWPGAFLPRWVDCYPDSTDPAGFTLVVNQQHSGFGARDQRRRCQRARANEFPGVLVPPEQLG